VLADGPYDPLFGLQPRHITIEVHPVDARHRDLHMIAENIRHTLCYHRRGPGRSGFASRRRLDRSSVALSLVLPELVMNPRSGPQKFFPRPQIARLSLAKNAHAAQSARIVGLMRQSLVRLASAGPMCHLQKQAGHTNTISSGDVAPAEQKYEFRGKS